MRKMDIDMDNVEILDIDDIGEDISELEDITDTGFEGLSEAEIEDVHAELEEHRSLEDIQAEKEALLELRESILANYSEWTGDEDAPEEKVLSLTRHR